MRFKCFLIFLTFIATPVIAQSNTCSLQGMLEVKLLGFEQTKVMYKVHVDIYTDMIEETKKLEACYRKKEFEHCLPKEEVLTQKTINLENKVKDSLKRVLDFRAIKKASDYWGKCKNKSFK